MNYNPFDLHTAQDYARYGGVLLTDTDGLPPVVERLSLDKGLRLCEGLRVVRTELGVWHPMRKQRGFAYRVRCGNGPWAYFKINADGYIAPTNEAHAWEAM